MSKFKSDIARGPNVVQCLISESIKKECDDKIKQTTDFLGQTLSHSIKVALEERRKVNPNSPLTYEDILALENVFMAWRLSSRGGPIVSAIEAIEEWAITFLGEKINQRSDIDIQRFLLELTMKILNLIAEIQNPYDELISFEKGFIKKTNEIPDPHALNMLIQIGVHVIDATHIAVAVNYVSKGERVAYVTTDYGILNKREEIREKVGITCCDPVYAIYHLM
jgi:rRNA maturation endonuclease Nob1